MNNYKMLCLLLFCNGCTYFHKNNQITDHLPDKSDFKTFFEHANTKLKKSAHNTAAWLEYYRQITTQNINEWVEYCKASAKNEADAFKNFIIDESDATFAKLHADEQKAIRDLNNFHRDLARASKEKQQQIIKDFSVRWEEIKKTLNKRM